MKYEYMTISFRTGHSNYGDALSMVKRIEAQILEKDETIRIAEMGNRVKITVSCLRASELCAELVREGYLDG